MKRAKIAIALLTLASAVYASAGDHTYYLGTDSTEVVGINDLSQIVLFRSDYSGSFASNLITAGSVTLVQYPGYESATVVSAINNHGSMVGLYYTGPGVSAPFLYKGGTYSTLPVFPGSVTDYAQSINDYNQIVGEYQLTDPGEEYCFSLVGSVFTTINPPTSTFAEDCAVNNAGQIVGTFFGTTCVQEACGFIYSAGTYTVLQYPSGQFTVANGISNSGEVVGTWQDGSGGIHGFFYSGGVFTSYDYPEGNGNTTIFGENIHGAFVGTASAGISPQPAGLGFYVTP
jgi:probable HAF family extracellular repeat protein